MKDVLSILSELRSKAIAVHVDESDSNLRLNGRLELLSESDKENLKKNKQAILSFLKDRKQKKQEEASLKITQAPEAESYPMSNAQRRLWFLSQFEKSNIAYNIPGAYEFDGGLNYNALESAINRLVERHEILRTVFKEDEKGEIRQFIRPVKDLSIKITYYKQQGETALSTAVQEELNKPFDLSSGPLLRVALFETENNKQVFTYTMHHIISDGWSMDVLIKELLLFYNAILQGISDPLPSLQLHYKDYAVWQLNQSQLESNSSHKQYWLDRFNVPVPVLEIPADYTRPAMKTYNGDVIFDFIGSSTTEQLKALSRKHGGTLFIGLLAALKALFYKYTGQEDITIGSPVAGREQKDLENQIGLYMNILALRTQFSESDHFEELLEKTKEITIDAYNHQLYPFDELVEALKLKPEISRNPLFDIMVVLQNTGSKGRQAENSSKVKATAYEQSGHVVSKYDLTFIFEEEERGLGYSIEFNTDIYKKESIQRLASHFNSLLRALLDNPSCSLNQLEYLTEEEKEQLLVAYTGDVIVYPDRTIITLFEEQTAAYPGRTAVRSVNGEFSYAEINERSNRLARYLLERNALKTGDLAGIKLVRSEWMIISILAVLKTGAAYVPVDTSYPADRINYILEDSGCKVVIDEAAIDKFKDEEALFSSGNLQKSNIPEDLVYVIYTSGSTGKPKGVKVTHGGLNNYLSWASSYYFTNPSEGNFGLFTSFSFDLTVTSIFLPLMRGRTLEIFDSNMDVYDTLKKYFTSTVLDSIKLTPSHLQLLDMMELKRTSVKKVILGGEKLYSRHVGILTSLNPDIEIYNEYGPTEATVGCMIEKVSGAYITIGKPIANTKILILDDHLKLVPTGITGELYIGGKSLAKGYLNNEELSFSRFIENPYAPGEIIYKTGDAGKWLPGGSLDYIGRKDEQLKIRGHRIESGEIESALRAHPEISESLVLAKEDERGEKHLVAYYIGSRSLAATQLKEHLFSLLPAYMVPSYFIQIDKFTLTANGKTDKDKLPAWEGFAITETAYAAPGDDVEERLAAIWSEILVIDKSDIGIDHNFFELGGNSIRIIQLSKQIEKVLGTAVSIPVLFEHTTIRKLASFFNKTTNTPAAEEPAFDNEGLMDDLNKFNLINYED
jgi:amino acid adenylation domain-containing protein